MEAVKRKTGMIKITGTGYNDSLDLFNLCNRCYALWDNDGNLMRGLVKIQLRKLRKKAFDKLESIPASEWSLKLDPPFLIALYVYYQEYGTTGMNEYISSCLDQIIMVIGTKVNGLIQN